MGWGRMFLLGEWGQQMDIRDQQEELRSLRRQVRRATSKRGTAELKGRIAALEEDNDELRLHLAALVRYLGNNGTLQKDEFAALVDAVDSEDGQTDGSHEGPIIS